MPALILGLRSFTPKLDRVLLAMLLAFGAVALIRPAQALDSLRFVAESRVGVLPFLIV